jgi:bifunctional polynucleotide phosphatase/kinase
LSSVFPIFEKRRAGDEAAEDKKPFRWLTPSLGPTRSCLHGVHLAPTASERVAAFDLDGTIIKSNYIQVGRAGGKQRVMKRQANRLEWEWWRAVVPQKLKEVHDSGCALLFSLSFPRIFAIVFVPPSLISVFLLCSDIVGVLNIY